ncbi:MAG: aspartyl protease family protein [Candidatus Thiodiazotropha sp. (ex Dulcina madagascariensis)]|nr:aspartyl protease family protein [Candidatus Thiodiazotropha sp. (ex Dulcina madagascariensis)]
MNKADCAFICGNFEESEAILLEWVESEPTNAELLKKLGMIALWKNDLQRAEDYFQKAVESRSLIDAVWPFNAEFNNLIALMHLRADRFNDSARFYGMASGPFGIGFIKETYLRQKQLSLFENAPPYIIEGEDVTDIDFVILDPLPVVKARINGSEPVNFVIDTGGDDVFIDKDFAREINVDGVGKVPVASGVFAGNKGAMCFAKIDALDVGDMRINNIPATITDLQPIESLVFDGMPVKGIIGTRFLMHFLPTIDYKNKKLVLRRATDGNRKRFFDCLSSTICESIPFYLVHSHLMFAQGSFNGKNKGLYLIDTGLADAGFLSSQTVLKKSGVAMDWSKPFTGAGIGGSVKGIHVNIDEVALGRGGHKVISKNVKGVVLEKDLSLFDETLGFIVNGLISHQFFRDYALTLDFKGMLLILH